MKFNNYKESEKQFGIGGGSTGFMDLVIGDNNIRIVAEFEAYGEHWDVVAKKPHICIGKDEGCIYCGENDAMKKEADKAGLKIDELPFPMRAKYMGWVIDRKDGNLKPLTIGHQIFKQIGEYAQSAEYAFEDVPSYDINIKKSGEGLGTEYKVIPSRKDTPLTSEESALVSELKLVSDIIEKMKAKEQRVQQEQEISNSSGNNNAPVVEK